jgi:hypothetical protein
MPLCGCLGDGMPFRLYQMPADMSGPGYTFTGQHDAAVTHNSAAFNLNTIRNWYANGSRL